MNKIINLYDKMVVRGKRAFYNIMNDEAGASDIVAVVVIIVILLSVAVVFKNKLMDIMNALGDKVTSWIKSA